MCGPYLAVSLLELESDDIVPEFLPHPLPGGHIEGTMNLPLEFLQAGLIYNVTIEIKQHTLTNFEKIICMSIYLGGSLLTILTCKETKSINIQYTISEFVHINILFDSFNTIV